MIFMGVEKSNDIAKIHDFTTTKRTDYHLEES